MTIKNDIKSIIIKEGKTLTEINNCINNKFSKKSSIQNFVNKLSKETIKYKEVLEIADVLGYEIKWVKKI